MLQELLAELGLSPNEGKIYETLLERGELSAGDISIHAKIHRRNTYDALNRLVEKGLCFEVHADRENMYSPVDPGKLKEIIAEKQGKLEALMPDLVKKFGNARAKEEVYIYKGLEGQKNIWRDLLREGKDNYVIGGKGNWFDPALTAARDAFFREANRKKLEFHMLYDHELIRTVPDFAKNFPGVLHYRVLPKEYSTNSTLNIFGDYMVTYSNIGVMKTLADVTFFVIHSKNLAESYRKWFAAVWAQSRK